MDSVGCQVGMFDRARCGRPIHPAPPEVDPFPCCLMHSHEEGKNTSSFRKEFESMMSGKSRGQTAESVLDFTRFEFPVGDFLTRFSGCVRFFEEAVFRKGTNFAGSKFEQSTSFRGAKFKGDANFENVHFIGVVDFVGAVFEQNARFHGAKFLDDTDFAMARFKAGAYFVGSEFGSTAKFSSAWFAQVGSFRASTFRARCEFSWTVFGRHRSEQEAPESVPRARVGVADFTGVKVVDSAEISLYSVNLESRQGLRAQFSNSDIERFRFENVRWHHERGRLVLQEEIELSEGADKYLEIIAITYRRLINNFEEVRAFDLAEDCFIGAMEMQRLNPHKFLLASWKNVFELYAKHRWAYFLGANLSIANLYRLLSNYGSSYTRALFMLAILLLTIAILFPAAGLRPAEQQVAVPQGAPVGIPSTSSPIISWCSAWRSPQRGEKMFETFKAGVLMTAEVSTFQRQSKMLPATDAARLVAALTIVIIPGQAALLALALRRRFQR